jgi:hypothetical protein
MTDKDSIKKLAMAYDAYCEYSNKGDYTRVIVYGDMLRRAQLETGVEIIPNDTLVERLAFARAHEHLPVKTELQRAADVVANHINSLRGIIAKVMAEAQGNGMSYVDAVYHVLREVAK